MKISTTNILNTARGTLQKMNILLDSAFYAFEEREINGRTIWFKLVDISTRKCLHQYTLNLSSAADTLTIIADYEVVKEYLHYDRADIINAMLWCMIDCKIKCGVEENEK